MKRIKTDIHNCSALITEPKLLTQNVMEIYARYVRDDAVESNLLYELCLELLFVFRLKKQRLIKILRKNMLDNVIILNEQFVVLKYVLFFFSHILEPRSLFSVES